MRSRGKRAGLKSKYLHRGLTLAVWAKAGVPVCLGSVCTVPLLVSLGLVSCYTSSGTCLESATPCHTLAVPSALTPADTAKERFVILHCFGVYILVVFWADWVSHTFQFFAHAYIAIYPSGCFLNSLWSRQSDPSDEAELVSNSIEFLCYYFDMACWARLSLLNLNAVLDKYKT